jgi:uncharacterized coiled-coil DUF342 family protein
MGVIAKAREKMQELSESVHEFIAHYKNILGQIESIQAENEQLEAKIKELRSK